MIREAELKDLPHFARAAQEFVKDSPFTLDLADYLENVVTLMESDGAMIYTTGEGHCAIVLIPSLYDSKQRIGRVISTWGNGGLRCFRACEAWAKENGAQLVMADVFIDGRIGSFYERIGMTKADQLYMKVI